MARLMEIRNRGFKVLLERGIILGHRKLFSNSMKNQTRTQRWLLTVISLSLWKVQSRPWASSLPRMSILKSLQLPLIPSSRLKLETSLVQSKKSLQMFKIEDSTRKWKILLINFHNLRQLNRRKLLIIDQGQEGEKTHSALKQTKSWKSKFRNKKRKKKSNMKS